MSADDDRDQLIEELRAKVHVQEVVINTLRGMLFTAWTLTNSYDRDKGTD
jgi:hypothetical protein